MNVETKSLPMVALRGLTVLPEMVKHFDVSRTKSIQAIEEAMEGDQKIFLSSQIELDTEDPGIADVYRIGCIASIKQVVKLPKKMLRVLIVGETRARLNVLEFEDPYLRANVTEVPDEVQTDGEEENPLSVEAMRSGLQDIFKEYLLKNPKLSKELAFQVEQTEELQKLVDVIAANVPFGYKDAQLLLEEQNLMDR